MPFYRAQITLGSADNVAENYATNVLHFAASDDAFLPLANPVIVAAYNSWRPQMSNLCRQNNHELKWYDLADPKPRAPIMETTFNLSSAPTGNPLPPEVSLCCSFQSPKSSGTPQARKRGRAYLPWPNVSAIGADGRPTSAAVAAAVAWGDGLLTASLATTEWAWIVYSTIALGGEEITNGWVDNEFDTQRRRGRDATTRSVFN